MPGVSNAVTVGKHNQCSRDRKVGRGCGGWREEGVGAEWKAGLDRKVGVIEVFAFCAKGIRGVTGLQAWKQCPE